VTAKREVEDFESDCLTFRRPFGKRVALFKEPLEGGFAGGLLSGGHNPTGCVVELDFLAGEERRELFEVGIVVGEIGYFEHTAHTFIIGNGGVLGVWSLWWVWRHGVRTPKHSTAQLQFWGRSPEICSNRASQMPQVRPLARATICGTAISPVSMVPSSRTAISQQRRLHNGSAIAAKDQARRACPSAKDRTDGAPLAQNTRGTGLRLRLAHIPLKKSFRWMFLLWKTRRFVEISADH